MYRGGKWRNAAPGCDLAHEEGLTVSQRGCAKAVERLSRAKFGRLFGAYGINIKGLGGNTCHCTGWEYRDIGRLFITVGGEESDNRGVELGGGDSPGQSGGHSPQAPATFM